MTTESWTPPAQRRAERNRPSSTKATKAASQSNDWNRFAEQIHPDAVYWEHLSGRMNGRDEIRAWIVRTMSTYPGNEMPHFPSDWHMVDEESGRTRPRLDELLGLRGVVGQLLQRPPVVVGVLEEYK